ncbi:MAG: pyridoxal phosphate-dependent aminotransferase [Deltaproteobacteria bacterium]|nr:pyridoxal phosphate-dependent aminotransferase [Deltaproteobacteria bacterium]
MQLARRIRQIPPSATLALNAKANALKAQGVDVVNFGVGEPDFDTPDHIKQAAVAALESGFTRYTPVGGIPELKEAIIQRFEEDLGLSYRPAEIMVSCGGKHALYNLFQVLFDPGDEVVVPAPYWVSYPPMLMLAEAVPVIIPTREENGFKLTPEELRERLTPRTKGLILNSPSNPTGMVYSRPELEALAEVVLAHDLVVISDDIYNRIIFDGLEFVNLAMLAPELKARTFVLNGVSKTYAMTGWRIGYAAGPEAAIAAAVNLQSQSTSNPTSIAQKASVAALRGPQDFVARMVGEFAWRRDDIYQRLLAIPGVTTPKPEGAFYIFPNFSAYYDRLKPAPGQSRSQALAEYLLEEARVAAVPGAEFGEDACIRLSYATSRERIATGLARIREALEKLGK